MYRPSKWVTRNVDLGIIRHGCILNPLVERRAGLEWDYTFSYVARPVQWLHTGWRIIEAWWQAYVPHMQFDAESVDMLAEARQAEIMAAAPGVDPT